MEMPIVITTYMREEQEQQKTFYAIPKSHRHLVHVFCRAAHAELLKKNNPEMNVITIPDDTDVGIARTRQVVLDRMYDMGHRRVWMMDDRLRFALRDSETGKVRMARDDADFAWIYDHMNSLSKQYVMVSLSSKKDISMADGDGNQKTGVKVAGRAYANYALQLDVLKENEVSFDGMWKVDNNIRMMEDFYVVCTLLSKGIPNVLTQDAGFDHKVGEAGGNSTIRTFEMQETCCRFLASLYPEHVKIVQKESAWGDLTEGRIDVQIQWKRLLESGQRRNEAVDLGSFFDDL